MNPLVNTRAMLKLNPFAAVMKRKAVLTARKRLFERELAVAEKRKVILCTYLFEIILFIVFKIICERGVNETGNPQKVKLEKTRNFLKIRL